jgi:hypothetical protein
MQHTICTFAPDASFQIYRPLDYQCVFQAGTFFKPLPVVKKNHLKFDCSRLNTRRTRELKVSSRIEPGVKLKLLVGVAVLKLMVSVDLRDNISGNVAMSAR